MAINSEEIRTILEQHISGVYSRALTQTGDPASAKEITRRVMSLLKRTCDTGMSVTDSLVNRLTDDCCQESLYYAEQRAIFKNGTIADMPDFDTALSSISEAEVAAANRRASEEAAKKRAAEAALRAKEAEAAAQAAAAQAAVQAAAAQAAVQVAAQVPAQPAPIQKKPAVTDVPHKQRGPVDLFDDYGDDDEAFDDDMYKSYSEPDIERDAKKKPRSRALPVLLLVLLAVLLLVLIFCLVVMLITRGVLPGANNAFIANFAAWFNSSFFILF